MEPPLFLPRFILLLLNPQSLRDIVENKMDDPSLHGDYVHVGGGWEKGIDIVNETIPQLRHSFNPYSTNI